MAFKSRPKPKSKSKSKSKSKPKPKSKPNSGFKTVDEYLESLSRDKRVALERLRRTIQSAVPRAEECISYRIPAFRLDGKTFVWFGAAAHHCALYGVDVDRSDVGGYDTSKGTIRFQPNEPLPATLVRKLVKSRLAAIAPTKSSASRAAKPAMQRKRS
jgi:uncharacterized protein YdhG (YjbR/CyaY superfamily)